jgi:hypothetical protein
MKTVALVLLSCAATLTAQQRDFTWHGPVARGSFIEIRGINGDVRAQPSLSGEVEVEADVQGEKSVDVRLVRSSDGSVTICSVFPGESVCRAIGESGPGTRVNYIVRVPEGVHFLGSTVNGEVEAKSLNSDVQASTVNGEVRVSTTGTLRARTVNGSITASLGKPFWSTPPELSTVNGGIRLVLPPSANASVQAETKNGKIVTDFSAHGRITDQQLVGRIGDGGRSPLVLRTVNGTIELKRSL